MHLRLKSLLKSTLVLGLMAGIGYGAVNANASTSYSHPYNALNNYISLGHYVPINNRNYMVPGSYSDNLNQNTNPNRQLKTISGNWKDSYKPYATFNRISDNPQSVVITPSGTAYISFNLGDNNVRIARYNNINNRNSDGSLANPHVGKVFHGGHAQSMAYNPKSHQLWMQDNDGSATNDVKMLLINKSSLTPEHTLKFDFDPYPFGNALAFDNNGNAYTGTDTPNRVGGYNGIPKNSFKLYKGRMTAHSAHFHMIRGLRHEPGAIIQNMSYNPANNRLYILADGNYTSINLSGNVTRNSIHTTKLNQHYEPEDLAFYGGHTYLMLHYPNQLMINTRNDGHNTHKRYNHKHYNKKANKNSKKRARRTKNNKQVSRHKRHVARRRR